VKHRRRRYPIPGHPRWVGHYAVTRVKDSAPARYEPQMVLHPVRWRAWRAGRWVRQGALEFWCSLYERTDEQEKEDRHVRMQQGREHREAV
jgi:hypothetical protein